jgi:putative addiction module component (TIGR02574 family)
LLEDALTLAPNDRAHLAAELLASLDENESEVETAWAAEIQRRAADARENPDDDEDWRVVLDEIQREVLSR